MSIQRLSLAADAGLSVILFIMVGPTSSRLAVHVANAGLPYPCREQNKWHQLVLQAFYLFAICVQRTVLRLVARLSGDCSPVQCRSHASFASSMNDTRLSLYPSSTLSSHSLPHRSSAGSLTNSRIARDLTVPGHKGNSSCHCIRFIWACGWVWVIWKSRPLGCSIFLSVWHATQGYVSIALRFPFSFRLSMFHDRLLC